LVEAPGHGQKGIAGAYLKTDDSGGRAGAGGRPIFVDIDVDVCDRAEVPGCPAAAPGGITADELREIAFVLARDPRVNGIDIAEIDATIDADDGRTVRLAALLVLEAAAGLAAR